MPVAMNKILKLSISEKISIVDQIWKTIPKEKVSPPISEEVQILLTNRLKKIKENPNQSISLEESKQRTKARLAVHRKNRTRRAK